VRCSTNVSPLTGRGRVPPGINGGFSAIPAHGCLKAEKNKMRNCHEFVASMEGCSSLVLLLCVAGSVHVAAPVPKGPDAAGAGRSLSIEHILCKENTFHIDKPSPRAWAPRFARRMSLRGGAAAPPRIGVLGSPPPDDFEDARKYYGAEHIGDHLSTESEPGASACARLSPRLCPVE